MAKGDLVGATVAGKYAIKRLLGAGGMGAVYEAEHVEIGKRVAVKVIDPLHATSPEMTARFKREARAASAIESDHIVQVFDAGLDERAGLYMVMEYLVGEDLAERLARERKLGVTTLCGIVHQIASALAKAHAAGIVHRDLKPANVFLCARDDGTTLAKVLDFGIAKFREAEVKGEHKPLTRRGTALGTPQYMSPEQAQGLDVDARADVWALGALMYEALAGRPAYEDTGSYEGTIVKIVTTEAPPIAELAPHVPSGVARIVTQALARKLDERIPNGAAFAKRLLEAAPTGASLPPLPSSSKRVVVVPSDPRGLTPITLDGSRETQPGPAPVTGTGVAVPAKSGNAGSAAPPPEPEPQKRRARPLRGIAFVAMAAIIGVLAMKLRSQESAREETKAREKSAVVAAPPAVEPLPPATSAAPVMDDAGVAADVPPAIASSARPAAAPPRAAPPKKLGDSKMDTRF